MNYEKELSAKIGRVAISKSGRDKGRYFIIIDLDGVYAYVVDGELRKLDKPKKKKIIHLRFKPHVAEEIAAKVERSERIFDYEIRQALNGLGFNCRS